MPVKARTAKGREFRPTPEMVDMFVRGRRLQKRADSLRTEINRLDHELHVRCGLFPWDQTVLTVIDQQHWPRAGNLHDESGKKVLAIRRAIEAALEEADPRKRAVGEPADGD